MAGAEGSYDEDVRFFFFEIEAEEDEAGSTALRFKEPARDNAFRVGEDMACVEASTFDDSAGVGEIWVVLNHLVTRLFGDGVSVNVYCSRAALKLGTGSRSTSMSFSRDRIIRNNLSAMSSLSSEETELSMAL